MKQPKSFFRSAGGRILCVVLVLAALAGGFFATVALLDPLDCRIQEGVTIGGLEVGGMKRGEARKALTAALEETLCAHPLTVQLPEETLTLTTDVLAASVDVRSAVKAAYACGREETAVETAIPLLPYLTLNEEGIRSQLVDYAARWDTELRQPEWALTGGQPELATDKYDPEAPGQILVLTKGVPSLHLDIHAVYGEILAACNKAIPLCRENSFSIRPEIAPEAFPEELDLDAIYEEVTVAATDDSLDMVTYAFVNGTYGYAFDLEETKQLMEETPWGQATSVPMVITEPEILGDAVYFRDVLGHCETKHTDDENRNTNLRLLCEALDGVILQPGQEFSYNETVGERTEEKGYKPATAYSGKSLIKDIGGGVCQGSTTLYNCALLADLEILERVCHGAKVGYITLGLDAAVNWNTKTDLRFKNNFHFPMMIKAEVSDGYVKMQLLGTDEKDYYIEMRCGQGEEGDIIYAVSYKVKYDKETGEQISKEREANSTYYPLG